MLFYALSAAKIQHFAESQILFQKKKVSVEKLSSFYGVFNINMYFCRRIITQMKDGPVCFRIADLVHRLFLVA